MTTIACLWRSSSPPPLVHRRATSSTDSPMIGTERFPVGYVRSQRHRLTGPWHDQDAAGTPVSTRPHEPFRAGGMVAYFGPSCVRPGNWGWRSLRLRYMGEGRHGRGAGTSWRRWTCLARETVPRRWSHRSGSPVLIRGRQHQPTVVYRVEVLILLTAHTPGRRREASAEVRMC